MHDIGDFDNVEEEPGLLIFRFDSPLFFANAQYFLTQARQMISERIVQLRWFALQAEAIVDIDSTGLEALEALVAELEAADIRFVLVRAKSELVEALEPTGSSMWWPGLYLPTLPTLVAAFREAR